MPVRDPTTITNKSASLVAKVRELLAKEYDTNKEIYDPLDVKRFQENDWTIKRYLLDNRKDADATFLAIKDVLKWRKLIGVAHFKDTDFPREFYEIGGIFPYEVDKKGNVMIYCRIKVNRRTPEVGDLVKKFIVHIIEKVDRASNGNGFAMVFDCSNCGIANVDMDLLKFVIQTLRYYPYGLQYALVYELPWVLNAFFKLALAWIPGEKELVKFANKKQITDEIDRENLPDYMGGTCKRDYRLVPAGCQNAIDFAREKLHMNEKDVKRLYSYFDPYLPRRGTATASS